MFSVPWNIFSSIQYTHQGSISPLYCRFLLTKNFHSVGSEKNGACHSPAGVPSLCGNMAAILVPPVWCHLSLCCEDSSGTSFWACFFAAVWAFPETGTSIFHLIVACSANLHHFVHLWLGSVTELPSGFLSSFIGLLAIARAHRNRQETITTSRAWDSDVLHKPLGNIHHHLVPS